MTQYPINHAKILQKKAFATLDLYNKMELNNKIPYEKWEYIVKEFPPIMDIELPSGDSFWENFPESPDLAWEELEHNLASTQRDLLKEMGIYCIKEIVFTLWGLNLAAIYIQNPREENIGKLLFATELICYSESSLSGKIPKRSDIKNRFVSIKSNKYKEGVKLSEKTIKIFEEEDKQRKTKEDEAIKKKEAMMTKEEKEAWKNVRKRNKALDKTRHDDYARYKSYFSDSCNSTRYREKFYFYKKVVEFLLNHQEAQNFIHKSSNTSQESEEKFSLNKFIESDEFGDVVKDFYPPNRKKEEVEKEQRSFRSVIEKLIKIQRTCMDSEGTYQCVPKDALRRHIISQEKYDLLPKKVRDDNKSKKEFEISLKDAFFRHVISEIEYKEALNVFMIREIKNGELYYLNPRKR